jgi:FKBP-type peptidyl-prolyl cis-trans isomerase FklB
MQIKFAALIAAMGIASSGLAMAGDISRQANAEYLEANAKKPGVIVTPSGLQYRIIESGPADGETPTPNDMVRVFYTGKLVDGYVFERVKNGETKTLPAGQVIAGWKEALSMMKEGDHWELVIPSQLAYGPNRTEAVPSNQVLTFDMKLIEVVPPKR